VGGFGDERRRPKQRHKNFEVGRYVDRYSYLSDIFRSCDKRGD
jgi:hypothetical protein